MSKVKKRIMTAKGDLAFVSQQVTNKLDYDRRKKVIEIQNFFLGFEQPVNGKIKQILSDINLGIYQGEKLAIIGESGSGKTVLSNAIACLLGHDAKKQGKILIDGIEITRLKGKKLRKAKILGDKVSYVFQNPLQTLNPYYRIGPQLMETLKVKWHDFQGKARAKKKVLEVLTELNLPNPELVFNSYPHQLSGGMIQRVVIACSLLLKPKVLILDEPTSALDAVVELQILGILNKIAKLGTTIILISHDLNLVSSFADRIAVMYAGKLVEVGTNQEINLFPRHPYTWGLLMSIPSYGKPLYSIPGRVPADLSKIVGDSFAPRNPDYAMDIDFELSPKLFQLSKTHFAATWLLSKHAPAYQPPAEILKRWKAFNTIGVLKEEQIVYSKETYDPDHDKPKVLEINNLNITYDNKGSFSKVVHNVDLHIDQGEIVGLIGESGSGKSTIAKSVSGLVNFSANKAEILGVESPRFSSEIIGRVRTRYARSLQMIYQNPAVSLNNFKKLWKVVGEALFHHPEFINKQMNHLYQQEFFYEQEVNQTVIQKQIARVNELTSELGLLKSQFVTEKKMVKLNYRHQKRQLIDSFLLDLSINQKLKLINWKPELFLFLRHLPIDKFHKLNAEFNRLIFNLKKQFYNQLKKLFDKKQLTLNKIDIIQQKLLQEKQKLNQILKNPVYTMSLGRKKQAKLITDTKLKQTENKISNLSVKAIRKHVLDALKQVGLSEIHMEMYPWQLSGGQQQRAAIARSLLMHPKLLIADEPIASLDVSLQSGIISLIGDLVKKNNMSILFISHDLEMLSQVADRVYVLHKGVVVEKGRAIEIFAHPIHPYTRMLVSSSRNKGYSRDLNQVFVFDPQKHYFADQKKKEFWQVGDHNHFVYANHQEFETWSQWAGGQQ